ncbi:MAG: hypothetical protein AAF772_18305 [Acidobacteriota bacterium]
MDRSNRVFAVSLLLVLLAGLALVWGVPRAREALAPTPIAAHVAIQLDDQAQAMIGPQAIPHDAAFTLHAVLEARDRSGAPVYYTEATALRVDGADVPAARVRPWTGSPIRARWFTVEPEAPWFDADTPPDVATFFRSDWPMAWSVPGRIDPAHDDALRRTGAARAADGFGTQRYHVRLERYAFVDDLLPEARYISADAEALRRAPHDFAATVVMALPDARGPASALFGLGQVGAVATTTAANGASALDLGALRALIDARVVFTRASALRDQIRGNGHDPSTLEWRTIERAAARWGETVQPGDLLRVGDRVVVLHRDAGVPGALDDADLCFDFARGAAVRPLGAVFDAEVDEEGGAFEHASLQPAQPARG